MPYQPTRSGAYKKLQFACSQQLRWVHSIIAIAALVVGGSVGSALAESLESVRAVHIVSKVGDAKVATDAAKRVRADESVTLFAVLEVRRRGGGVKFYSNAGDIRLRGSVHKTSDLSNAPSAWWMWHKIEPSAESMSNTASGRFRFEKIDYAETMLLSSLGDSAIKADVRPTLTTDRGRGVGSMRYKLAAFVDGRVHASPGTNDRAGSGRGGLSGSVHRVTVRRDDSYLGYLTELYGQPYIWASAGKSDRTHQSELLEGSDCADFVVYGKRRMGVNLPYTWTGSLPQFSRLLSSGTADEDGVYRDAKDQPIKFPKVGDLVLFPRHVGVLTADKGRIGFLDHADVMMHSYFASPREQRLGDSDYASSPTEVRRWKQ